MTPANKPEEGRKKIDLLPCPFCGGAARVKHKHYRDNYQGMRTSLTGLLNLPARTIWFVGCFCGGCPVMPHTSYDDDKNNAVSRWNTRKIKK